MRNITSLLVVMAGLLSAGFGKDHASKPPHAGSQSALRPAQTLATTSASAEPLKSLEDWSRDWSWDYSGDIDNKLRMGMTIKFDGNKITGTYFYVSQLKDIRIEGTVTGRAVKIQEFDPEGKPTGVFEGTFVTKDPRGGFSGNDQLQREVLVGDWSKPDGAGKRPFYLQMEAGMPIGAKGRYGDAGFEDDQAVDEFMQKFRHCLLAGEREVAADMVDYPVSVYLRGKPADIHNAKELIKNWDAIMTPAFRQRVANAVPFHMFSKCTGVMLGDGAIWIAPIEAKQSASRPIWVTKVIAINNLSLDEQMKHK